MASGWRFEQPGFLTRMVTMGNAAGCSVCGSDNLVNRRGSDAGSKHQCDLDRAGSGWVSDESLVRGGVQGSAAFLLTLFTEDVLNEAC